MSFGIPRFGREEIRRAGRDDREARVRAGEHVDAPLHHPVAAPGEDELGALVESALDLRRRLAALRHLAPERVGDALGLEARRSSSSPPPSVLPEWAMTATFIGPFLTRARLGGGAGRPAREHEDDQRGDADERAAGDVERVVHAAIHARHGDEDRDRDRDRPGDRPESAVRDPRGEQQDEAAVDRDRGRRVAGRVARVHRQVLEPEDAGPVSWTTSVVARYVADSTTSAKTANAAIRHFRSTTTHGSDHPTTIGSTTPPATIEPISEASVRPGVRCAASQT